MIGHPPTSRRCEPLRRAVYRRCLATFTRAQYADPLRSAEAVADWVYWRARRCEVGQ